MALELRPSTIFVFCSLASTSMIEKLPFLSVTETQWPFLSVCEHFFRLSARATVAVFESVAIYLIVDQQCNTDHCTRIKSACQLRDAKIIQHETPHKGISLAD